MVGFRIQNQESLNAEYSCPSCLFLLRDPVQLIKCAHRVCQSCIDQQKDNVISCPECHEKMSRDEFKLDRGFRNDMQTLSVHCMLCSWIGMLRKYQNHLDDNHANPICTFCNEKFTSVNNLNAHVRFACEKITVSCPLQPIGCEEQIRRIELSEHYASVRHQRVLINFVQQFRRRNLRPRTSIHTSELLEADQSINALSSSAEPLRDELKRLDLELKQGQNGVQSAIERLSTYKTSGAEQDALLNTIMLKRETFEDDIQAAARKFEEMKLAPTDGFYIWKIDHVHDKTAAARSGEQLSIDSRPFSSSPTGHKMCLRLYLNGDDNARGSHLSLHFIHMRGEFDAILKYPFCYKVIFCLYDQSGRRNHIVQLLQPNVASNSNYQRPRSDMVVADEISKFASLETLQQEGNSYIREDTMYIKTMINFDNIVREIIPYAVNLSPALTTPIQQAMIQEEIEKQRRA